MEFNSPSVAFIHRKPGVGVDARVSIGRGGEGIVVDVRLEEVNAPRVETRKASLEDFESD